MRGSSSSSARLFGVAFAAAVIAIAIDSANATAADPTVRITTLPMYQAAVPVETGFSITFVSSGYLDTQSTAFQIDVAKIVRALIITNPQQAQLRSNPLARYRHFINLFGVFVPSQEEGLSEESIALVRDTALQCTYTSVAPSEWRGTITCDKETTLGYGSVSPANAFTSPQNTAVIAIVNSPYYGADHQSNAIFISNQYLKENLINTTVLVLYRLLAQVWFNLADEFDYGEMLAQAVAGQSSTSALAPAATAVSPLAGVPNCFDPSSPDGNPWSTAIFEQKLDPKLASLSQVPPYDTLMQLSDVPVAPCTFSDALKPSSSCLMQRKGTASVAQRNNPAAVDPTIRKQLLWDATPTRSAVLTASDSVPHFCYVCTEAMTRSFLTSYWARSDASTMLSGLNRLAMFQLPRCPLPNEISILTVSESFWLFTNKHATWENGFETRWELELDNRTVFLAGNVTQMTMLGARVIEFSKRASNTIRLTTTDRLVESMMGPTSFTTLKTRPVVTATTTFLLQIVTNVGSVNGVKLRVCDSNQLDFSGITETNGNNYRYSSFCQGGNEAACTYNYTVGSLQSVVGGFRISVPVAISLFAALGVIIAPWVLIITRYNVRIGRTGDPKLAYLFVPLRRHVRMLRWFVFASAAAMVVIALSLWLTSMKLYVITQTITSVVLGIALAVATLCNIFGLLPAYGSLLRDWKPLLASSVLLFIASVALIVTGQLLLDTANNVSPDTALGSTLQSGWRSLVSTAPSTACSFEEQTSCSGWQYSCIHQINSIDCPQNCAANKEQRTPCSSVVEALITSQLSAVVTLLRGAGGVMIVSSVAFALAARGMYDMRHAAAIDALSPHERQKREERKKQRRLDRERQLGEFRRRFRLPSDRDSPPDDGAPKAKIAAYESCLPEGALSHVANLISPNRSSLHHVVADRDDTWVKAAAWEPTAQKSTTLQALIHVMDATQRPSGEATGAAAALLDDDFEAQKGSASPLRDALSSRRRASPPQPHRSSMPTPELWRDWRVDDNDAATSFTAVRMGPEDELGGGRSFNRTAGDLQHRSTATAPEGGAATDGLRHRRPAIAALLQELGSTSAPQRTSRPASPTSAQRNGRSPRQQHYPSPMGPSPPPPPRRRTLRWDDDDALL